VHPKQTPYPTYWAVHVDQVRAEASREAGFLRAPCLVPQTGQMTARAVAKDEAPSSS